MNTGRKQSSEIAAMTTTENIFDSGLICLSVRDTDLLHRWDLRSGPVDLGPTLVAIDAIGNSARIDEIIRPVELKIRPRFRFSLDDRKDLRPTGCAAIVHRAELLQGGI